MKKIAKSLMLAFALVLALSVGAGTTAEAAKKVTVKKVASVNKLTGKKTITLTKGKKATLKTTVTVTPNKAANKKVTYKSSNKKVAAVSSKGVITAKKAGTAKITVTSKKNKKKKATVTVKVVTGKVSKVTLDKTAATLKVGAKETLKATVKTKGKKPNKTVKWTSSDTKVATVSSKGVVTAVGAGTATITVKSTDGTNKTAKAVITVEEYQTVVAPKNTTVEVEVAFKDVKKVQEDVDTLAKAAVKAGDDVEVYLDGQKYVATYDGKNVKIGGKLISDSVKANAAKSVKVKVDVKADKIAAITAFVPASVSSVKYGDVTFTDITATSFKVGDKTYEYTVDGKNIVIKGDVKADFAKLETVATITVK